MQEGTVTVLFTDVERSSELGREGGDRSAHKLLRAHGELVRSRVEEYGGREIKALGDGFMVAFSSARRAVSCAVAIQRALEVLRRSEPERFVPVRMGLNAGEAIHEDDDLFGAAVTAAARISSQAKGQQIVASEIVKSLVGNLPEARFNDLGEFQLRGFDEQWRLFEVAWRREMPAATGRRTPLVGRERERAELRRRLDELSEGKGSLVLIGGEPGVGKTRLAEETSLDAQRREFRTLTGRCYDMDSPPPYLPFLEVLEAALKDVDRDTFRLALGDAGGELAKVMPQLRNIYDDLPPALELPPEQERRYLFNSIGEFVARAAATKPLVVIFDDLHWADESSVSLLQNVARGLANIPVLLLGTYRSVELDVNRPFSRVLEDLVRQRLAHRILLKRLSQEGVRTMLERLGGEEPPETLARAIFQETDGNAFFVEEVFRHLAEEGRLFDHEGRWQANLAIDELDVPESVRLVIGRRLQSLRPDTLKALTAAAVLGRTFDYEVLEELQEVSAGELLDAIEEAQGLSLVRPLSDSPMETRFEFVHELIRQTLLGGTSPPRRRRLHNRIARAIEKVYADDVEDRAPEIVEHLIRGGSDDPQITLRYLLLAGARAQESAAFEDALRYYERALDIADLSDDRVAAQVRAGLGRAQRSLGRLGDALRHWREALDGYERLQDVEAFAGLSNEMVLQLAWAAEWAGAIETAARGLAVIGERQSPERAVLLAWAAVALGWAGDYATSKPMLDQAVELANRIGDRELLGQVLTVQSSHLFAYAFVTQAIAVGLEACDLLRDSRAQWDYASALAFVALGLASAGRFSEVAAYADELTELSTRLGFGGGVMYAHLARQSMINARTGDPIGIERAGYDNLDICQRYDLPWLSVAHVLIAGGKFLAGDLDTATQEARRGAELDQPGVWLGGFGEATLFRILAYAGKRNEALEVWEEVETYLPRPRTANGAGPWSHLGYVIDGWYVLGDRQRVAGFYPLVEEATTLEMPASFDGRTYFCSAGIAAGAAGKWDEAEAYFDRGLELTERIGFRIESLDVRRFYGAMLLDRNGPGDRERATALLEEAMTGYETLGLPVYASVTKEWLGRGG